MIAITPAKFDPRPEYIPFARGYAKGAGKGAAGGAATGAYVGARIPLEMGMASHDPAMGAIALLILPFTVVAGATVGSVAGAVGGTVAAVPEATARQVDATISAGIASLKAAEAVGRSVMEELSSDTATRLEWMPQAGANTPDGTLDFALLKSASADAAIDIRVLAIGFEGTGGANPSLTLIARTSASLVYMDQAQSVSSVAPVYRSAPHQYNDWATEDGKLLFDELQRTRVAVAKQIVERVVLTPAAPQISDEPVCGPGPLPPAASAAGSRDSRSDAEPPDESSERAAPPTTSSVGSASGAVRTGSATGAVRTRSVTGKVSTEKATVNVPQFQADKVTLRWEHYPSERQRGLIGGDLLDGVRDTIYDLKVWIVDPSGIASVVYGRRGITETSHLIEIPLRPGPVYYWSVRARFHYRDRDAATPWSGTSTPQDPTCAVFPFPDTRRFRFRTRVD